MVIFSSSSSSTPRPFLLPIILLIIISCSAAFSAADDDDYSDQSPNDHYLGHTCSSSTFESNGDYPHTLTLLVNDLLNNALPGTSVTRWWPLQSSNNHVFGLAQCRGDISQPNCRDCVNNAAIEVNITYCPNKRSATMWRDHCELKYSDVDFYGKIDFDNKLTITDGIPLDSGSQQEANTLLINLSQQAVSTLFANGTSSGKQLMYGMAQCTADLSKDNCTTCLGRAVSDLSMCCGTFGGARVNFGSCNVRREMYPFLK